MLGKNPYITFIFYKPKLFIVTVIYDEWYGNIWESPIGDLNFTIDYEASTPVVQTTMIITWQVLINYYNLAISPSFILWLNILYFIDYLMW